MKIPVEIVEAIERAVTICVDENGYNSMLGGEEAFNEISSRMLKAGWTPALAEALLCGVVAGYLLWGQNGKKNSSLD